MTIPMQGQQPALPVQPSHSPNGPGTGYTFAPTQLPPVQPQVQQQQQVVGQNYPQQVVPGQQSMQQVPQPGQQQQVQQVPQQQFIPNLVAQPQQQIQAPVETDLSIQLRGQNIPAHLQGRSVADLVGQYNVMQRALQQQMQQAPQQQQQQQVVPQQSSMQTQQQATPQGGAPATEFFRDPGGFIERAIEKKLGPTLQRVEQDSMLTGAQRAAQMFAAEVGPQRFQELYPHMQPYLNSVLPQQLSDVASWRLAARAALGEQVLAGRQVQTQQQPQQFHQQQQPQQNFGTPAGPFPVQMVGPNGQPMPGMSSFFTETPGSGAQHAGNRVQLTPMQRQVFDGFRAADPVTWHSEDVYVAWLGGVQPVRR